MANRPVHLRSRHGDELTSRQREVLALVAKGLTNAEIAEHLGITLDGAKYHVSEIIAKLEVGSREEAAELWREHRNFRNRARRWIRLLVPAAPVPVAVAGVAAAGGILLVVAAVFAANGAGQPGPAADAPGSPSAGPSTGTRELTLTSTPSPTAVPTTGIPEADRVLHFIAEEDIAQLRAMLETREAECGSDEPVQPVFPQCPPGVSQGTVIEVFDTSFICPEGGPLPLEQFDGRIREYGGSNASFEGVWVPRPGALPNLARDIKYQLVWRTTDAFQTILLTDGGRIAAIGGTCGDADPYEGWEQIHP